MILLLGVGMNFIPLEFDADAEIVEVASQFPGIVPARTAGMPGAPIERHELDAFAVTPDQQVG